MMSPSSVRQFHKRLCIGCLIMESLELKGWTVWLYSLLEYVCQELVNYLFFILICHETRNTLLTSREKHRREGIESIIYIVQNLTNQYF